MSVGICVTGSVFGEALGREESTDSVFKPHALSASCGRHAAGCLENLTNIFSFFSVKSSAIVRDYLGSTESK